MLVSPCPVGISFSLRVIYLVHYHGLFKPRQQNFNSYVRLWEAKILTAKPNTTKSKQKYFLQIKVFYVVQTQKIASFSSQFGKPAVRQNEPTTFYQLFCVCFCFLLNIKISYNRRVFWWSYHHGTLVFNSSFQSLKFF